MTTSAAFLSFCQVHFERPLLNSLAALTSYQFTYLSARDSLSFLAYDELKHASTFSSP